MTGYDALARVYDKLNRDVDHGVFADFYEDAFRRFGRKKIESVLDLGCGTGSMTLELARRGYDMTGLDSSDDMLAVAHERAAKEGISSILWLGQDMTDFELYGTVDAAVSCLDCVGHLTTNAALVAKVEDALAEGGIEAAKDVCRNTRGPVASIFYQGLLRYDQGVDVVEKTIVSYGSVQMSNMENGLSWISLFIAIAPSLGFLGTVIGMIQAFDAIQAAGDISPNVVAGGMKVALITTVGGLIVAMILQVFYNYILAKIDAITIDMEDSSICLIDALTKYNK